MSAVLTQIKPGIYRLQGSLGLNSVVRLLTQSEMMFHNDSESLSVDLGTVKRVESAGLSLLVEWQRRAQKSGKTLGYQNIPAQLIDIARLSGVAEILGLAEA